MGQLRVDLFRRIFPVLTPMSTNTFFFDVVPLFHDPRATETLFFHCLRLSGLVRILDLFRRFSI
jgi:hypothetical protein